MSKTLGAPGPADSRGTKLGSLKEGVYDMDDDSDDSSSAVDMSTSGR
jgi:hypothetical protein